MSEELDEYTKKITFYLDEALKLISTTYNNHILHKTYETIDIYNKLRDQSEILNKLLEYNQKRLNIITGELNESLLELTNRFEDPEDNYVHKANNKGYLVYSEIAKKKEINKIVKSIETKANRSEMTNVRSEMTNRSEMTKQEPKQEPKQESKLSNIYIDELDYTVKLPQVKSLKEITPMFYYYAGDKNHTKGVYCSFLNGIYMRVPFPEIIDSTKNPNRVRSVRCKYGTKEKCDEQASRYYHYKKVCNYAHTGEKINKIAYNSRCRIPNFGNPSEFNESIDAVYMNDIKNLLLYGLNDTFLSMMWFYHHHYNEIVLSNLDDVV